MATKKEIYAAATDICEQYGIEGAGKDALLAILEPKKGGAKFEIGDVTCTDEDGTITHILDSVLKVWMPVYDAEGEANFYEKPDTELGWSRFSRVAEKLRKDAEKAYKATKDAVLNDLLAGEIEQEDAKQLMEDAEANRKNYIIPDDVETSEERPCEA